MNGNKAFGTEAACRIRSAEGLICQIRKDYKELTRLWQGFRRGTIDAPGIDEAVRLISYIREGLGALSELRRGDPEGVLWTGLDDMARDISDKEMGLRIFLFSVAKEMKDCHVRGLRH